MPEDIDPQRAEKGRVENVTERGRYGKAPSGEPHMDPEVAPLPREGAEQEAPPGLPGSMPENAGDDPADLDRERGKPGPGRARGRPPESAGEGGSPAPTGRDYRAG